MTIFNNKTISKEINEQISQLMYYGNFSYIDCQYLTYLERKEFTEIVDNIVKSESNSNDGNKTVYTGIE